VQIEGYDIDLEKIVKTIKEKDYKRFVLQIPEGLKIHASKFVDFFEKETNATVMIYADPCFGACDLIDNKFNDLDVDFVIQIGHLPIPNIKMTSIPTVFVNARSNLDIEKITEKSIEHLKGKKVGLVTTAQHVHTLEKAKKILIENNFEPFIGKGNSRIESKGQILGCNFTAATAIADIVDSFLFIGSGNFHPLGLMLSTKKPVIVADPYSNEIKDKELDELKDMVLRQRYGAIARSKDAKIFGILIGVKTGQQRSELAYKIKDILSSNGKKSYIFVLDHFFPAVIESFKDIDCFISTACPRIAIDDYMQYKVPILTPVELDILFGIRKWEDYQFDEILD
jgi:2-(3-amino-3-carboxypropyl)histidine synthase